MSKKKVSFKKVGVVLGVIIALFLIFIFFFTFIKSPFKGKGNTDTPFQIENSEDIIKLTKLVSGGKKFEGKSFVLTNDIDMEGVQYTSEGCFSGVFDGNGYCIKNLNIASDKGSGLFYEVNGTIANLTIESGCISGKEASGAIVGYLKEGGNILNCCNFATVESEDGITGGIAGRCDGRIINCASIVSDDEPGGQHITGDDETAQPENCYTWNGELFELICNGYDENKINVRKRALKGLNNRIAELIIANKDLKFNTWSLTDEFPYLKMNVDKADGVVAVSIQKADASSDGKADLIYDFDNHAWICDGSYMDLDNAELTYSTENGNTYSVKCERPFQEISLNENDMDCVVRVVDFTEANYSNDQISIDTDGDYYEVLKGYYDESGLVDEETEVIITGEGTYSLSGELDGRVEVKSESKKVKLILDGVNITSKYNTGIYAQSEIDFSVELADDSNNSIDASNHMSIYNSGDKHEGAISTDVPVTLYGNTGSVNITGDIEGIESAGDITIEGGKYYIETEDDSLAAKGRLTINDGFLELCGYDNCIDCDEVYIEGGILSGSNMYTGETFMKTDVRYNGGIVAYGYGKNRDLAEDTKYNLLVCKSKEGYKKGSIYVVLDKDGNPLLAYKCITDTPGICFGLSREDIADCTVVEGEDIEGEWKGNVCLINL